MKETGNPRHAGITSVGAFTVIALLAGCTSASATADLAPESSLSGIVESSDGTPVEGALVTLVSRSDSSGGIEVTTNASGEYFASVPDGVYDVVVTDTDMIQQPGSNSASGQSSTLSGTTAGAVANNGNDHGNNIMIGEIVVSGPSRNHLPLSRSIPSQRTDPDQMGGRLTLTLLEDGNPAENVTVVVAPATASSYEADAATLPDARKIVTDSTGVAETDLETDQIIGMDLEILSADGTVQEIVPLLKPEGDIQITIDLSASDVIHAATITGAPTEEITEPTAIPTEASEPLAKAPTTAEAPQNSPDQITSEDEPGTALNRLRTWSDVYDSETIDPDQITGWNFTGQPLHVEEWMRSNSATPTLGNMSNLPTTYKMPAWKVPTNISVSLRYSSDCNLLVVSSNNFNYRFTTSTGSTHMFAPTHLPSWSKSLDFRCAEGTSVTEFHVLLR
ncbi:carboxypeptidase-like regulatory domain-containing protein [Rhodoglobus sp. NPDC076762]